MKTVIKNDKGTLTVQVGRTLEHKEIDFKPMDLDLWYPFNPNFDLRYSEPEQKLYLYPLEKNFYPDYGMEKREKVKREEHFIRELENGIFYNTNVAKSNEEVINLARLLHIKTIRDDFDLVTIKEGLAILDDLLEDIREVFQDRLMDVVSFETFSGLTPQVQDTLTYEQAEPDELEDITMISKIRHMLLLMNRMV